jgi:hypothetical protein
LNVHLDRANESKIKMQNFIKRKSKRFSWCIKLPIATRIRYYNIVVFVDSHNSAGCSKTFKHAVSPTPVAVL